MADLRDDRLDVLLREEGERWRADQPLVRELVVTGESSSGRPRWVAPTAVAAAVLVVLAAAFALARPDASDPSPSPSGGLTAPPTEGTSTVRELTDLRTIEGQGDAVVDLGTAPSGTTHMRLNWICLAPGGFTVRGHGSTVCSQTDVDALAEHPERVLSQLEAPNYYPSGPGEATVAITASPRTRWRVGITYVEITMHPLGVNDDGMTFGAIGTPGLDDDAPIPDLIPARAVGRGWGWVYSTTGASRAGVSGRALDYVYASDGTTRIGDLYERNSAGMTIGTPQLEAASRPDLIPSRNAEGLQGYVLGNQAAPEPARNPQEALEQQRGRVNEEGEIVEKLYARDGKTVIGEVVLGRVSLR